MIKISVDENSIRQMKANLGLFGEHLPRHLATAVNRAARSVRVEVAQALGPLVNLKLSSENKGVAKQISKAKTLKKTIKQKNKAEPGQATKARINAIAPSLTDTPLAGRLLSTPEKKEAIGANNPMKRVGEVEDIAEMAAFLLSDKSSWITGQILHVDGGQSTI